MKIEIFVFHESLAHWLSFDVSYMYSSFTLTWLIVNDFQVEFFSFNHQKQWNLSVCKKDINQVRVNAL